ncbi:MAG: bifunctional adenosylcobinamide kinase/adenosylcobinamide-phosphate guanylyltransferase [Lautropia sp.]|nr:bifunctional adenosylcobinamide kinase/adenosylcobinamide-phosphate guanylyltransferase [Lautropia sp.]
MSSFSAVVPGAAPGGSHRPASGGEAGFDFVAAPTTASSSASHRFGRELILGGQRSGKSRRAEWRAQQWLEAGRSRRAVFIATAMAHDDEMRARIERHRADRAERLPGMVTVEEPLALADAIQLYSAPDRLLVIDCLTLWLANQYERIDGFCDGLQAQRFLLALENCPGPLIMVSNEIGFGVVPMGREVRAYVDALGWLNQRVAARCDRVCLMAAGLPIHLKDEM